MSDLIVLTVTRAGITDWYQPASAAGDEFLNDGNTIIEIVNSSGANSYTVTFATPATIYGEAIAEHAVSVGTSARKIIGPFPVEVYNDSDRRVQITYTGSAPATDLTIEVIQLDRAQHYELINADYYVDSIHGNDNYNGKSMGTPFATIAKLLTVLTTGQTAGLARGCQWREQMLLPANDITVKAYGLGDAPLLDCSDAISTGSWAKTGGQTYVYEATVSPALGTNTWNSVWENGTRLVRATSIANCDATAGSYYPSSDSSAPITLYVHATGDGNPASNGKTYEFASRKYGIVGYPTLGGNITGITLDGIWTRRNLHNDGSIALWHEATIRKCLASDGMKHNLYYGDDSLLEDVTALNAYYGATSHTYFVHNEDSPAGIGITHRRCKAHSTTYDSLGTAFYGHNNISGDFGVVTYDDCIVANMAVGVNGNNCTIEVDRLTVDNVQLPCRPNTDFTLKNSTIPVITDTTGRGMSIETAAIEVIVQNVTFSIASNYTNAGFIYSGSNNVSIDMDNVVFDDNGANSRAVYLTGTGCSVKARRCTFDNLYQFYYWSAAVTLDSDYNTFAQSGLDSVIAGTTYTSVALYQAATGQDAHSTIA